MRTPRAETLERLRSGPIDLLVIGGGITGARIALEGARLGRRVALVDGGDFAGGTSKSGWRDCDDHVAFFVTQVDVTVRLDNLIQRVAAVDHRPKRATLGEFLQHQQV
ncbi:MAG: FAD-dependent oxidoreductase [Chloroflexi bacterium]|nr:MAG: FAD-dependent oxidoreductase [Chloroflexota bacterium]